MRTPFILAVLVATPGCTLPLGGQESDPNEDTDIQAGGGGCGPEFGSPLEPYEPGSYAGRDFLRPANHLGEDIVAPEGTPVRAIGDGEIVAYRRAAGYGELVVVIEHDLGQPHLFVNGAGEDMWARYILSIYGHVRDSYERGGEPLGWRTGDAVEAGQVIGFVNDDEHNGDGAEHLHLGVRLMSASEAAEIDPAAWFRGYDSSEQWRADFAEPEAVIEHMQDAYATCATACDVPYTPAPPADTPELPKARPTENVVRIEWHSPTNAPLYRMTLSGRIVTSDGTQGVWQPRNEVWNQSSVVAELPLFECQRFVFSGEYEDGDTISWSCLGDGIRNGQVVASWGSMSLEPYIVREGGGCGFEVIPPCADSPGPPPSEEPTEPTAPPETDSPPADEPPVNPPPADEPGGSTDGVDHTIDCAILDDLLAITVRGDLTSNTLWDGGLPSIGFISVGSDETGWGTSTSPPEHFAIWNGSAYPHTVHVPIAVRRFNLWAAGPTGVRWFNLANWSTDGTEGCTIVSDSAGGLVIER